MGSEKETFARSSAFLWHLRFKHNFFRDSEVCRSLNHSSECKGR